MSDLLGLARGFAGRLYASFREHVEDEWDNLEPEHKNAAKDALEDLAKLTIQRMCGDNVDRELAHVQAQIANWKYVGSEKVRSSIKQAFADAAVFTGKLLLRMVL